MIGFLAGTIIRKTATALVLRVGDVGYEVTVSPLVLVERRVGEIVELWCRLIVSDDKQELFGFMTSEELDLFRELDAVSGVGPRSALAITAMAEPDEIRAAIGRGDPSLLQKVSGIGKKTAERIVVELRSKYEQLADRATALNGDDDVVDALISLGYSGSQARAVLVKLPRDLVGSSERIRAALKQLS